MMEMKEGGDGWKKEADEEGQDKLEAESKNNIPDLLTYRLSLAYSHTLLNLLRLRTCYVS